MRVREAQVNEGDRNGHMHDNSFYRLSGPSCALLSWWCAIVDQKSYVDLVRGRFLPLLARRSTVALPILSLMTIMCATIGAQTATSRASPPILYSAFMSSSSELYRGLLDNHPVMGAAVLHMSSISMWFLQTCYDRLDTLRCVESCLL